MAGELVTTEHALSPHGDDFYFEVREDSSDRHVIEEVITKDCYHLDDRYSQWEPFEEQPHTILDLGGNIGAFSVLAARYWPEARIITCEPQPDNYAQLQINLELNGATNVEAHQLAVWNHNQGVHVFGEGGLAGTHDGASGVMVPSVTLDGLAADLESIDLLKIDVEGAEGVILLGASSDTLQKIQEVVGEFHGLDHEWGQWVRRLAGYMTLTIRAHDPPNQIYGGLFSGRKDSE